MGDYWGSVKGGSIITVQVLYITCMRMPRGQPQIVKTSKVQGKQ